MVISDRAKEIIEYLLDATGYVRVSEIAKELGVTERTVYREMPEINNIMESCDLKLESQSGRGMQIYGSLYNMKRLESLFEESKVEQTYTAKERNDLILLILLHENDYVKTQSLAIDLNTSTQTIRNSLHQLQNFLENDDITLITKRSEGVILKGKEISKRHLLISILLRNIPLDNFFDWMKNKKYKSCAFINLLIQWDYEDTLSVIYDFLDPLISKKRLNVSDKEFQEFLFLLCIFIKRHSLVDEKGDELKLSVDIPNPEQELYKSIKHLLEHKFHIKLYDTELNYFNWMINLYTGRTHYHVANDSSILKQLDLVTQLIARVEERFGFPYSEDENLAENLMLHINMALERIRSGMNVSNPLNDDIYQSHPKLYDIVRQSFIEVFKHTSVPVPDDEIGYIVIYFIASMEYLTKQSIEVLVVCASGMGSSKMLRSRLEREFAEIDVEKIISLHKLSDEDLSRYDLIISTVPLDLGDDKYICVSPLLNDRDKEETRKRIKHLNKKGEHHE